MNEIYHGRAICEQCKKLVKTTYEERDVMLSDGSALVPRLLVGVCIECNSVLSVPAQSTAQIAEALSQAKSS